MKRMNDDEVMDHVYKQIFGDLDGIEAHQMFDEGGEKAVEGTAPNAEPASKESGGFKITIEPSMVSAHEGGRKVLEENEDDEEEKEAKLAGMSPLMAQLHGKR